MLTGKDGAGLFVFCTQRSNLLADIMKEAAFQTDSLFLVLLELM
jgi:hypothetical protein